MAQVILLGTGAAYSDATREHTYLAVRGKRDAILVDCGGSPIQRLERAGVPLELINHIILTHHHPDHLYGLPILLLDLWLKGRKPVLHIYGLAETLRATRTLMHAFEWERWRAFRPFPVEFHRIPKTSRGALILTPEFSIFTTTTKHLLPTVGVRVVSNASGKSVAYSSDTEVCDAVVNLAHAADILFHEATTIDKPSDGHSSARQAGAQAARANAKKLVLVHLPPHGDVKKIYAAAKKTFRGAVVVGKDFARFEF